MLSLFNELRVFIAVTFLVGLLISPEPMGLSPAQAETFACAHRGDTEAAPENTLPAIQSAVEKGAAQIEFDLQLTKDGRLVLMHDLTLKRTTGQEGKVGDYTLDEIKQFDAGAWHSEKFERTPIPTFEEVLEIIPHDILCNCHLKGGPEVGAAAARVVKELDRLDHCFLAATIEQAEAAKEIAPDILICNMSRQTAPHTSYAEQTIELGCEFIQLLGSKENLKETVQRLHDHGVQVNFFHGNNEEDIRALIAADVDYILTDRLDLCLGLLETQEGER
ncbi:MAG: glycerophosphodiester phosphodiesterase [Candidatus Omnitrophica bacterium]|nr:glycerophosphodiester phosphodiesterase [Candidatus Omnitrophota bacterium]MCB9783813.1 glycerophosphodiester phosphodiesterase [Candidatus Omnitrophota bacterium]